MFIYKQFQKGIKTLMDRSLSSTLVYLPLNVIRIMSSCHMYLKRRNKYPIQFNMLTYMSSWNLTDIIIAKVQTVNFCFVGATCEQFR